MPDMSFNVIPKHRSPDSRGITTLPVTSHDISTLSYPLSLLAELLLGTPRSSEAETTTTRANIAQQMQSRNIPFLWFPLITTLARRLNNGRALGAVPLDKT